MARPCILRILSVAACLSLLPPVGLAHATSCHSQCDARLQHCMAEAPRVARVSPPVIPHKGMEVVGQDVQLQAVQRGCQASHNQCSQYCDRFQPGR